MDVKDTGQGFFFSGAEFQPLSQWDLGDFFPNLKKKSQSQFFFRIFIHMIQSPHTHKLHGDNLLSLHLIFLQFNCKSVCYS